MLQVPTQPASADRLAPIPPLPTYYASGSERPAWLRRIFDDTARDYDRVERWLSLGRGPHYRREALQRAGLAPGMTVADVGAGTGLVAREAMAIVGGAGRVVAIDPSEGMLAHARATPGIETVVARAESLPFKDAEFDFLSMGYALRHLDDLRAVFREFARVLRPGGRICILELTRPRGPVRRTLFHTHMAAVLGLARLKPGLAPRTRELWRYFIETIDRCVPPQLVLVALHDAGFPDAARRVSWGALSEYTGSRA